MEDPRTLNYLELFARFARHKQYIDNVSPATLEGYDWAWKAFALVFGGTSVDKSVLVQRVAELRAGGMKPVTINTYVRTLNTFFHWLHMEGHRPDWVKIPRLKEEKKMIETFQDSHVERLIAFRPKTFRQRTIHTIVCLVLDTGARIDEVLSAERKDIDFDNLLIRIREGKGGKERVVPFSLTMRKMLFRFTEAYRPEHGGLLFFTPPGTKIAQRNALRDFKIICARLGIVGPRCSFHTLRHTFGKAYIKNGGDVFRLQKILGHAKLEMTRRYVNLETADLQSVHQQFSILAQQSK